MAISQITTEEIAPSSQILLPEENRIDVNPLLLKTSEKTKGFGNCLSDGIARRETYMKKVFDSYQRKLSKKESHLLAISQLKKEISNLSISYYSNGVLSEEGKKHLEIAKKTNPELFASFPESFTTKDQESWKEMLQQENDSVRSSIHSILTLDLPKEIRDHQSIIDTTKRIFEMLDRLAQTANRNGVR